MNAIKNWFLGNWKTNSAGILLLVQTATHWAASGVAPTGGEIAAILAGFGLIAAQDSK